MSCHVFKQPLSQLVAKQYKALIVLPCAQTTAAIQYTESTTQLKLLSRQTFNVSSSALSSVLTQGPQEVQGIYIKPSTTHSPDFQSHTSAEPPVQVPHVKRVISMAALSNINLLIVTLLAMAAAARCQLPLCPCPPQQTQAAYVCNPAPCGRL